MSTFNFFNDLEKIFNEDYEKKSKEKKRIVIPDHFLKLLLQNKSRLLKEPLNTKSVKEILSNRSTVKNNIESKYPNFNKGTQKYKFLEKTNISPENNKFTSTLPKIAEKKTILNLRYKEDPRNYEKFQNLGKELINISTKNNNNITEAVIPNKSMNKYYLINKKINSSENIIMNNNNSNTTSDNDYNQNLHYQNMTFMSPLHASMMSRNKGRIKNIDEIIYNDLNSLLFNNYFKNSIKKQNEKNNNLDNYKDYIKIININDQSADNIKKNHIKNDLLYNTINNNELCEYNYYKTNNNLNNTINKSSNKEQYKNINKKLISIIDNSNNSYNDNDINYRRTKLDTTQKKYLFNKKNFNHQINIRPLKFFNSFSLSSRKISKIPPQSKIKHIVLLSEFKHKYAKQEDIQKNLSKKIINFPLNTNISQSSSKDVYYYFINKMYRNQLIEYMKHRTNWELITKSNNDGQKTLNFVWKYMSNRLNFKEFKYEQNKPNKKLRMVNLFERNYEVGNKKNMFINLINYCDKININAFNLVPFTVIINNTKDVDYCLEALYDLMYFVNKNINTNKDLITNKKYNEHFWFDKNFEKLKTQYININRNFLSYKNYWILKPTDLYQGKCIEICNSFEEINKKCRNMFKGVEKTFIPELVIKEEELSDDENIQNINNSKIIVKNNDDNNNYINNNTFEYKNNNANNINNSNKKKVAYSKMYCSNEIIIQKYLDRPLLYYKRKFDIRCFVLVDSNLNVFFCREGHLKGSSEFYDLNTTNKLIHITNYSLQKKSSKFEQFEDGNEISYNDFKNYMTKKNISLDNFNHMINQMKYLIEISFKSVGKKLIKTNPVLCFEIFGYDFIIDNDFKPWILEINNNPGLCISSPVIQKLVPRMLDDAFRLTIDKVFETRYSPDVIDSNGNYKTKYQLDGFSDEENIFEFLCNVN